VPYNGTPGGTKLVVFKNSGGVDKTIWQWGFDGHTIGDFAIDLSLHGSGTTALDLVSGLAVLTGTTTIFSAGTEIKIESPQTRNLGTTDGETITREDELKTTDASNHVVVAYTIPSNQACEVDVEIVGIKGDSSISGCAKLSRQYLNNAGTLYQGLLDIVKPIEFVGGAPSWTVDLNKSGTDVQVIVNGNGDTVTWYVISSRARVKPAP
jgi:hypothetical protein